ncbi:uncharacterized protein [Lolium perenne]|uniref:uncharacterized protein n=1 Tax=Lolium perenne TaxID=4522 RepID=UPI003A991574
MLFLAPAVAPVDGEKRSAGRRATGHEERGQARVVPSFCPARASAGDAWTREEEAPAVVRHVRALREELQLLQEHGSYDGEVVKVMGKLMVLVKVLRAPRKQI